MTGSDLPTFPHPYSRGTKTPRSFIIAVASGKGGVGKSFVSSSLGIFLANMGFKTIIIDFDFGGANVHTCLGEELPRQGIGEFLRNPNEPLSTFILPTRIPNLSLLSPIDDSPIMGRMSQEQKSRLYSAIFDLPADFIVLDLAAGTHENNVDGFLMAQYLLMVMTPEPTSIESAYRFMRAVYWRRAQRLEEQYHVLETLNRIRSQCSPNIPPGVLMRTLEQEDPVHGAPFVRCMEQLHFHIVINQIRSSQDQELGYSVRSVCQKFFGTPATFSGFFDFDNAVWQSLRKKRPAVLESPHSRLYAQMLSLARDIVSKKGAVPRTRGAA